MPLVKIGSNTKAWPLLLSCSSAGLVSNVLFMYECCWARPNSEAMPEPVPPPALKIEKYSKSGHAFVFEPIFTSGICVLPNISDHRSEMSEALHINAGRLLCKYLSEEWDFSYNFANEDSSEASVKGRIRPWNAMMLISNDIMRYAEESDDGNIQNIDVNAMEKHANHVP